MLTKRATLVNLLSPEEPEYTENIVSDSTVKIFRTIIQCDECFDYCFFVYKLCFVDLILIHSNLSKLVDSVKLILTLSLGMAYTEWNSVHGNKSKQKSIQNQNLWFVKLDK